MGKKKELRKEIEELKDRLSLTQEQAETLNNVVQLNLQRTEFHLGKVKETTGEILMEDVTYCINLSNRITDYLKRNFNGLQNQRVIANLES